MGFVFLILAFHFLFLKLFPASGQRVLSKDARTIVDTLATHQLRFAWRIQPGVFCCFNDEWDHCCINQKHELFCASHYFALVG
jgi:hypothetical protein